MSRKEKQSYPKRTREEYVAEYENESKQKVTYYEVLGVEEDASILDIKKQFRQCAIDFHPDNKKTGDATLFALVARAYECLSDPEKRSDYDKMLFIEKKTQKSTYFNQKKAFDDFINAQDNEKDERRQEAARNKFDLDFIDIDSKRGFDRKKYDEELANPLSSKDTSRRLDTLIASREQDEIELTQRRIFSEDQWNPERFNELFEKKYKKGKGDLVKHGGAPSAFNDGVGASLYGKDELYDETDVGDESTFSSLKHFDKNTEEITDEDIKQLKKMKGFKDYKGHLENRGQDYQNELDNRLRERDAEDELYNARKIKDFDTDDKMGSYGFLHQVGLTGRELEWEEEDVDDKTMRKLIEFRNNEKKKSVKKNKK